MGLINAVGLPDDDPVGVPLIGYQNLTTSLNVTTTTEDADFPASNLGNPATHLMWMGTASTGTEYITIASSGPDAIDYVAIAKHNFGSINASVSLETSVGGPLVSAHTVDDDRPIIFRFAPQVLAGVRIKLVLAGTEVPQAAVVYVGKLLVLERGLSLEGKHTPINYGRKTTVVNGMSESGNFLGRIVLGEFRQTTAEFAWLSPSFYRDEMDDFLIAAQEAPFFWAWWPDTYPKEVGYVWLTNDAEPDTDAVTRRVSIRLDMRGIA